MQDINLAALHIQTAPFDFVQDMSGVSASGVKLRTQPSTSQYFLHLFF
jgi:hypothetical protein